MWSDVFCWPICCCIVGSCWWLQEGHHSTLHRQLLLAELALMGTQLRAPMLVWDTYRTNGCHALAHRFRWFGLLQIMAGTAIGCGCNAQPHEASAQLTYVVLRRAQGRSGAISAMSSLLQLEGWHRLGDGSLCPWLG